jgi:ankyrin repeat protein
MGKIDLEKIREKKEIYATCNKTKNAVLEQILQTQDIDALRMFLELPTENKSGSRKYALMNKAAKLVKHDKNCFLLDLILNNLCKESNAELDDFLKYCVISASKYGAKNIVNLLILKQNNIDINFQDQEGNTALHLAALYNHTDIVKLLLEHKSDINIKNNLGITPFCRAAAFSDNNTVVLFLKAGGNFNEIFRINNDVDISFSQLRKSIKYKQKKFPPEQLPLTYELPPSPLLSFMIYNIKGILSENNNEEYFKEAVSKIKQEINKLNLKPANYKSRKGKNVKKTKKDNEEFGLKKDLLQILHEISQIYYPDQDNTLDKYIIDYAIKWKLYDIASEQYNFVCIANLNKSKYTDALNNAEKALEYYNKADSKENIIEHNLYHNLGLSYRFIDTNMSIFYFDKALEYLPNDYETIEQKIYIYLAQNNKKKALTEAEKLPNDFAFLLKIYIKITIRQSDNLEKILSEEEISRLNLYKAMDTKKEVDLYNKIKAEICILKQEYDKAFEYYTEILSNCASKDRLLNLTKALEIYKKAELWEKGLEFIQKYNSEDPEISSNNNIIALKYFEFIFYEKNNCTVEANNCLDIIQKSAKLGDCLQLIADMAWEIRFYTHIEDKEYEKAIKVLKLIKTPASTLNKFIKGVVKQLFQQEEKSSVDEVQNFSPEKMASFHKFCQKNKKALIEKKIDKTSGFSIKTTWVVGEDLYDFESENIYKVSAGINQEYYATIKDDIADSLDPQQLKSAENAIKDAVIENDNMSNIKLVNKKLYEIKTNNDLRLYTTTKYKNNEDKILLVFDKQANHSQIKKLAMDNKIKLEIVEVPSSNEDKISVEDSDQDNSLNLWEAFLNHSNENKTEEVNLSGEDVFITDIEELVSC